MPTIVRLDEQDRKGQRDVHEVEIGSTEDDWLRRPRPQQAATATETSPPQTMQNNSISEGVGQDVAFEGRNQLVVVDQSVLFQSEPDSQQIYGVFEIANVSRDAEFIIFKVKTTSTTKFHVGPTIGIIRGNTRARVTIKVLAGYTMDSIKNESFLILAMVLPLQYRGAFSSSESDSGDAGRATAVARISRNDFPRLSSLWKEIADVRGTYIEEHRMHTRVSLPPPPEVPPPPSPVSAPPPIPPRIRLPAPEPVPAPSDSELRKRLTEVQEQVANSSDALEVNVEWITWLLYGLYVLGVFCTLFLWWSLQYSSQFQSGQRPLPVITPHPPDTGAGEGSPPQSGRGDYTCLGS